ncbi:cache domain-containing sensor histidine kinase [Salibacterium aidingense]|uniref:cache domain-containing sensor histidine kinase n=1 Tax=Salibacterium aidingense TaxID=384933 RepID=UPI003BDECCB9
MRWLRSFSFKQKLLALIFLCMLLPMLFSVLNLNVTSFHILQQRMVQSEENAAELTEVYLSNLLDDVIQTMNYVQYDEDVRSAVNGTPEKELAARGILRINEQLSLLTRNKDISLSIITAENRQVMSGSRWRPAFSEEEETYQQIMEVMEGMSPFEVYWIGPSSFLPRGREAEETMNSSILLGRRLANYNGETTAHLFASIHQAELDRVLLSDEATDRHYLLLNEEGRVLYGSEKFPPGEMFPYFKETEGASSTISEMENEEDYIVVQQSLQQENWKLVSYVPYQQAVNDMDRAYQQNFFIQAGAFAVFIGVMMWIIHRFFRPIQQLVRTAEKVEEGSLDIRANLKREDEIGRLGLAFDHMLHRIQQTIHQIKTEQAMKRKAEIAVLQSKIQPHFLFNILNTIRIQIMRDGNMENAKLISSLSTLLRAIYRGSEWVTLKEEIAQSEEYMKLLNIMRKHSVQFEHELEPAALEVEVPQFILQPLIENACYHGVPDSTGTIIVSSWTAEPNIYIEIADNGSGMEPEKLEEIKEKMLVDKKYIRESYEQQKNSMFGIGLKNVYDRMKLTYGKAFQMNVENNAGGGVTVSMQFPMARKGG